ncbi:hypothetical protein F2P81_005377 [Scophthalmus maximus]|uniref:Uncharacterized protein n=1 Tax=Scophthalmus maximus TaxID=52904 RepID=A0A6A4T9G1_SCOMX|nr:hypothetical protein F2P81_005377 [Scophthalmus maximus]
MQTANEIPRKHVGSNIDIMTSFITMKRSLASLKSDEQLQLGDDAAHRVRACSLKMSGFPSQTKLDIHVHRFSVESLLLKRRD